MTNQTSIQSEYSMVINILSDMITNYLTTKEREVFTENTEEVKHHEGKFD